MNAVSIAKDADKDEISGLRLPVLGDIFDPDSEKSVPNYSVALPEIDAGSPVDTDQVRKIREIYKLAGMLIEGDIEDSEEGEDEKRRRREAISLPPYKERQGSSSTANAPKTMKTEKPDYNRTVTMDISPVQQANRSAYVCMPGSKGACATCPVYSLMASSAARLSGRIAPEQFSGTSYLAGRNGLKTLTNFSRLASAAI